MLDQSAIKELAKAQAITAASEAVENAATALALPNDFALHDIEKYLTHRRRMRGNMATTAVESFARYAEQNAEPGSAVFIDAPAMKALAVLNMGGPDAPGHADHLATYAPTRTAAYVALQAIASGAPQTQRAVAEWIEDWADLLNCTTDGAPVETKQAVAAVRSITIESARKIETDEQQLSTQRTGFEQVRASSRHTLPTLLQLTCAPYEGLSMRTFDLRLGVLTSEPQPRLTLRVACAERHGEEMAVELAEMVKSAVAYLPVYVGTFRG